MIDHALIGLSVLTTALISWKALELYLPGLLYRASAEQYVTSTRTLDEVLEQLERGLPLLATIAAVAPFVGLAATIVHIRTALTLIGGATADTAVIAGPVATALGSTLLGLASAIPAATAYNLLARRLQLIENRSRRRLSSELSVPAEGV